MNELKSLRKELKKAKLSHKNEMGGRLQEALKLETKDVGRKTKVKSGFVYLLIFGFDRDFVKIGSTTDLSHRLIQINTSTPVKYDNFHYYEFFEDRKAAEKELQEIYRFNRVNGEWFKVDYHHLKERLQWLKRKEMREMNYSYSDKFGPNGTSI